MRRQNRVLGVHRFQVDDVNVRYVPSEEGMRLECTACQLPRCEHVSKVSAWITLKNAMFPTDEPDQIRARVSAITKRAANHPYATVRNTLGDLLSASGAVETTKGDVKAAAMMGLMHRDTERTKSAELRERIEQAIQEVQAANSDHLILSEIDIDGPVEVPSHRVAQLVTNFMNHMVGNGERSDTAMVKVRQSAHEFTIFVANVGVDDTPEQDSKAGHGEIMRSFEPASEPFRKASPSPGLDVCAEMAREMGGELTATSEDGLTCLVFRMPVA